MFLYKEKKKKAKIDKIIEYIEEINKKKLQFKIEDNTDDMFSKLRNELYKITIMLKEEAEKCTKGKNRISKKSWRYFTSNKNSSYIYINNA